jgi:hypothetical protein
MRCKTSQKASARAIYWRGGVVTSPVSNSKRKGLSGINWMRVFEGVMNRNGNSSALSGLKPAAFFFVTFNIILST